MHKPSRAGAWLTSKRAQIIFTAGHAAMYRLQMETSAWVRPVGAAELHGVCLSADPAGVLQLSTDVEGSLFVVQRSKAPHFQIVVLNKKSVSEAPVSTGKQPAPVPCLPSLPLLRRQLCGAPAPGQLPPGVQPALRDVRELAGPE